MALRLGIFVGFASFFIMEKTLRVLGNEDGHAGHAHSHSHGTTPAADTSGQASGVSVSHSSSDLRSRGAEKSGADITSSPGEHEAENTAKQTSKLSAYLNLFGDFVHNMWVRCFYRAMSLLTPCPAAMPVPAPMALRTSLPFSL